MQQSHFTFDQLQVEPQLLQQAYEGSKGNLYEIAELINHTLKEFINKTRLEEFGYREAIFYMTQNHEVKHLYTKFLLRHTVFRNPKDHENDPYFCGVVYPNTFTDVFITPKNNIIIQKSVDQEIHFCNGRVVLEQVVHRVLNLKVDSRIDEMRHDLPDSKLATIYSALKANTTNRLKQLLDDEFYKELEL